MTNQYVTVTVTEGEKTLTVTREKQWEWGEASPPPIGELIDAAVEDAKAMIQASEPF